MPVRANRENKRTRYNLPDWLVQLLSTGIPLGGKHSRGTQGKIWNQLRLLIPMNHNLNLH